MLLKICDSEEIIDIKRIDKKVNIGSESCLRCKLLVCSKLGRMCELRNWSKTYGLNLIGKLFCPFLKAVCKQVKDLLYINTNTEIFIYQIAIIRLLHICLILIFIIIRRRQHYIYKLQ